MKTIFVSLAAAAFATPAFAGPFGVDMGDPISSFAPKAQDNHMSTLGKVPNPHSDFESYIVVHDENGAICKIAALGKTQERDGYGMSVRTVYDRLKKGLISKYGEPSSDHEMHLGGIWDDADDWVMSIRQGERYHQISWIEMPLPDDIKSITLKVAASSSRDSYVTLSYEFTSFPACMKAVAEADNSAL